MSNLETKSSKLYFSAASVDGRSPANQVSLVVYPVIHKVFFILSVVGLGISEPSAVWIARKRENI